MNPLDAISETVALHVAWLDDARRRGEVDATVQHWTRRMQALQEAAEALRPLYRSPQADPPAHLSDLPPALIAQLSGAETDRLEDQVLEILGAIGGDMTLNQLLIELYRRHRHVHDRKALNNKAYRMVGKGLILQVEGRRGVYRLPPP